MNLFGMKEVFIETKDTSEKFIVRAWHKPSGIEVTKETNIDSSFDLAHNIDLKIALRDETLTKLADLIKENR